MPIFPLFITAKRGVVPVAMYSREFTSDVVVFIRSVPDELNRAASMKFPELFTPNARLPDTEPAVWSVKTADILAALTALLFVSLVLNVIAPEFIVDDAILSKRSEAVGVPPA